MRITIHWYDKATGEVFEKQDTTLERYFEDHDCDGMRTAIREEVRQGIHHWSGFGGIGCRIRKRGQPC